MFKKNSLKNKNETQNIFSHGSLSGGLKGICEHGSNSKAFLNCLVHTHETAVGILKKSNIICVYNMKVLFVFCKCFRVGSSVDNIQRKVTLQFDRHVEKSINCELLVVYFCNTYKPC